MSDETATQPTRRETLKYGGAIASAGLLAGCSSSAESRSGGDTSGAERATQDSTYEACIEPAGC